MATIKKNAQGYGYKYTDLAAINDYIESIGESYTQSIEAIDGIDYIITNRRTKEGTFISNIRGCRVVQASLSGKTNPAQEQGSGLTYARRYSLLMAYGLATEDDDGESLTAKPMATKEVRNRAEEAAEAKDDTLDQAKRDINNELIKQNYTSIDDRRSFIKFAIGKETIETIAEAREVAKALENKEDA